jgi:hypothetical protein
MEDEEVLTLNLLDAHFGASPTRARLRTLLAELEAARAVVEAARPVLRLDPGCDDHATGLDWCDRCHEAHAAHAELQHALNGYTAARGEKAGE